MAKCLRRRKKKGWGKIWTEKVDLSWNKKEMI